MDRLAESVLALVAAVEATPAPGATNPGSPDGFVGVQEAAHILNTTEKAIYNMVARCEIPHFKRGRRLLFSPTGLVRFIEQRRAPSPERNRR
jgi:excisionase family DNA binding protein